MNFFDANLTHPLPSLPEGQRPERPVRGTPLSDVGLEDASFGSSRSLGSAPTLAQERPQKQAGSDLSFLLIAPDPPASVVAQSLRRELDARVQVATGARPALAALRRDDFALIILEENLAAAEPEATAAMFNGAGAAPVLEINFGLCGLDRVLRSVRATLARRVADEQKARLAVSRSLQNELNASLAGLLLESQLALRGAGPEILPALQHLIGLASDLREQLREQAPA